MINIPIKHRHTIIRCPADINETRLRSTIPAITQFLNGGLPKGCLIEMGLPLGKEGRQFLLSFLAVATQKSQLCLWINGHVHLNVFAPMMLAHQVRQDQLIVANAQNPISQLKPAIINPIFKVVVIDSAKKQVGIDDCAFLNYQARLNQQWMIVIRPYELTNRLGNPWAKLRINAYKDEISDEGIIEVVRGGVNRVLCQAYKDMYNNKYKWEEK